MKTSGSSGSLTDHGKGGGSCLEDRAKDDNRIKRGFAFSLG